MTTLADKIVWINTVAKEDSKRAQGMLDMLNDVYNLDLDFLNKRVVMFEKPDASTGEKYAHAHDALIAIKHHMI